MSRPHVLTADECDLLVYVWVGRKSETGVVASSLYVVRGGAWNRKKKPVENYTWEQNISGNNNINIPVEDIMKN